MPLHIIRKDITKMKVDAIVNSTNEEMVGYSGVDLAVHEGAGPQLAEACAQAAPLGLGCAKITEGYGLPAKYIIHTSGPIWHGGLSGERILLQSCYEESLKLAVENGCESVDEAKKLLTTERRGVISVNGDNGYPYAVPINFLFCEDENKIYFHGSRVGHKIDSINKSDKVCFTVIGNETVKEEPWAPYLQSVIAFGRCHLIKNKNLNTKLIKRFAEKYYPNKDLIQNEIATFGKAVQMFEIEIEHLSGKQVQEK